MLTYFFYTVFAFFMLIAVRLALVPIKYTGAPKYRFEFAGMFVVVLLYAITIGLRFKVGLDYSTYLSWFQQFKLTGVFPVENSDIGYILLNKAIIEFGLHFSFLFIVIAALQIFFMIKALENFPFLRTWYVFFFFTLLVFFSSMNIMRQTTAFFIFFYALNKYIQRKYLVFFLLFILAFSFHKSVVLLFVLVPFLKYDWYSNKNIQIALLLSAVFILPLMLETIVQSNIIVSLADLMGYGYYLKYIDLMKDITKEVTNGSGFGVYLFFIIDFMVILYSARLKTYFSMYNFKVYYNLYFTGIILNGIFSDIFVLARIGEYFTNFRILILAFLCVFLVREYRAKAKPMALVCILFINLGLILFFYKAIYNNAAYCVPFQFLF